MPRGVSNKPKFVEGERTAQGQIVDVAVTTLTEEFGVGIGLSAFCSAVARTLSVQQCLDVAKQCTIEATYTREIQARS